MGDLLADVQVGFAFFTNRWLDVLSSLAVMLDVRVLCVLPELFV